MPFFVPSLAQRAELVDEMLHVACKRIGGGKLARLLDAHSLAIRRRFFLNFMINPFFSNNRFDQQ